MQNQKSIILISLLIMSSVVLAIPFLHDGIPDGHDIVFHTIYLRLFTDALSQGQFPVRWIEWFRPGLSQPVFLFYPPLYFYLAQLPHLLGFSLMNSSKIVVYLCWLLSGFLMYLLVKNSLQNRYAGIVGAIAYVFSPYHILDIFIRAAYPEATALSFVPGLFWSTERLIKENQRKYIAFTGLFIALIICSHPPVFLIFLFPYSSYCVFLLASKKYSNMQKKILQIILGLFLGIGLSAFFTLPAFGDQWAIHKDALRSGYYDFHYHFVCMQQLFRISWGYGYSIPGCADGMSFQIGLIPTIMFISAGGITLFLAGKKRITQPVRMEVFWILFACWGVFMTTTASRALWEHIPFLSFVQYPWRYLSILSFSIAFQIGILCSMMNKKSSQMLACIVFICITVFSVSSYLHPRQYFSSSFFGQDSESFYLSKQPGFFKARQEYGYFPQWTVLLPKNDQVPLNEIRSSHPDEKIVIFKKTVTDSIYILSGKTSDALTIFIHYFPGWQYIVDGRQISVPSVDLFGYPHLLLPKGTHELRVYYDNTPIIILADSVSLTALVMLIFLFFTSFFHPS